ncbi:MAG: hypothetical protein HYY25_09885 [Candidatus Wallbacteria bacterium]|nr:hypothetical protein [Candidatus Wallbacteria bacterium]
MSAFYRLLSELEEAGSGALGVVEPERLARVRASLLRVSEGRETAVAALLRLLDAGPSALPRIGRKLAARDLATLYTREAMSHLLERLTPLDLRATGMNLGVRFSRLGEKDVAGLKTESLEFAATPAGALWGALEEYVPRLLTSPEVPPETRQAVASKVLAAQGIRLLYERAGLPSPIDPARAFTGTITPTFSEVPKGVSRTLPAEQVAGLAGYSGPAIDLIKNDRENAAYVHKDAQAWYMAAVAVDHSTPGLKESDRVPAFTVPLEGGRDSAGDTCFLAWLIDVDPEDAFALNITPSSGSGLLSLSLVRPDCPGDTEGEFLVSVRVSGKLLPPGRYGAVLTVRRLLTQRRFLESQDRMRSILLRLILCSPR